MPAQLPPWLDVTPGQHLQAAEAGARQGLERRQMDLQAAEQAQRMDLQRDEMAQGAATTQAELAMKGQQFKMQMAQFMDDRKQQALMNSLALDKHQRDQDRADQELAMTKAYHDQTISINQGKLQEVQQRGQLAQDVAARKYQAQLEYARRINNGEDATQVAIEMGPRLGIGEAGLAQMVKLNRPQQDLPEPEIIKVDDHDWLKIPKRGADGQINYDYRNVPEKGISKQEQLRLGVLNREIDKLEKDPILSTGIVPKEGSPLRTAYDVKAGRLQSMQAERDRIAPPIDGDTGELAGEPEAGAPAAGNIIRYDRNGNRIGGPAAPAAAAASGPNLTSENPSPAMQTRAQMPAEEPSAPAPSTSQAALPPGMDEVERSLRFGRGFQTKAEKEILRNRVTSLDLKELLSKAGKYGLTADMSTWDGDTAQVTSEDGTKKMSRQQIEQAVYDAAIKQGW